MTTNKAQKQAIRNRMAKTGERYTAARATMTGPAGDGTGEHEALAPSLPGSAEHPVNPPHMSGEAIRTGTGKDWAEWLDVLDPWGAYERSHGEITRYVMETFGIDGWWANGVALGYDRIRGKREAGQRVDGRYSGTASKTVLVAVHAHQAMWVEEALRDTWLAAGTLRLRTSVVGKSTRFDDLEAGGVLAVYFTDKGEKSSASLEKDGLPSKEAAAEFRALWKDRMNELAKVAPGPLN